jgi:hypothetical protein
VPTKEQLESRVRELEEENDSLQDQLDQIFDIVAPREEKGEDEKHGSDRLDKTNSHRRSAELKVSRPRNSSTSIRSPKA